MSETRPKTGHYTEQVMISNNEGGRDETMMLNICRIANLHKRNL